MTSTSGTLRVLAEGEIEVQGLIPWSSNATLLVTVRHEAGSLEAVYKPQRGERPLWDFPRGTLGMREVATYLVCEALGWGLVPPTVLRQGPYGLGSVQQLVDAREDAHFFTIRDRPDYAAALRRLAAFDEVTNNADRKAGHCLVDREGRLWAIDNALTFHEQPKLRTVNWDYAGQKLALDELRDLAGLRDRLADGSDLCSALGELLSEREVAALRRRLRRLLQSGSFPVPGQGPALPWPLV